MNIVLAALNDDLVCAWERICGNLENVMNLIIGVKI